MQLTRSRFLLSMATGLGGALAFPSSLLGAELAGKAVRQTLSGFRTLVGGGFRVEGPRGPVDLVLVSVEERTFGTAAGTPVCRQYSLVFRAPDGGALPEGTWPAENDDLGPFALFVAPTRVDSTGARFYRADFNQLVQGS
jgi:hypothetical protein